MIEVLKDFQFTDKTWVLIIPISLIVIDFITGITKAWIRKEVKSSVLREGLGKKIGEILVLIIGELLVNGLNISGFLMDAISIYISFMEIISIFENLEVLGVPIPKFIRRALGVIDKEVNQNDLSSKDKQVLKDNIIDKECDNK